MSEGKPFGYYECPLCGYRISDTEYKAAAFDYACVRCKRKKLSEYLLIKDDLPNHSIVKEED